MTQGENKCVISCKCLSVRYRVPSSRSISNIVRQSSCLLSFSFTTVRGGVRWGGGGARWIAIHTELCSWWGDSHLGKSNLSQPAQGPFVLEEMLSLLYSLISKSALWSKKRHTVSPSSKIVCSTITLEKTLESKGLGTSACKMCRNQRHVSPRICEYVL